MPLNKSTGNMYDFITHTWNTIKGECPHGCSYCYMKRWGKQPLLHFDEKELKTDLGKNNFIFVGSSCDMFADGIRHEWIARTLDYCKKFSENEYLVQTKNPARLPRFIYNYSTDFFKTHFFICTTLETNIFYNTIIKHCDPRKVNIGADSSPNRNKLPEPPKEKILELIAELEKFTTVVQKKNLRRLLK